MSGSSSRHGLPLRTPSLILRWLARGDAAAMMALNAEASTRRWLPSHVYDTLVEAEERMDFLASKCESPGDPRRGPYVLGVALRNGTLVGHVGFSPLDADVEVSYAIAEAHRGRGLGTEALMHGCRWASATFGLGRIIAVTASANTVSRSALAHAAFAHERDEVMRFQGIDTPVSRYAWSAR